MTKEEDQKLETDLFIWSLIKRQASDTVKPLNSEHPK